MNRCSAFAWIVLWSARAMPELDTTGAIRCGTDGLCPEGYQCRLGRCCPVGSSPNACPSVPQGIVGAPCAGSTCMAVVGTRSVPGVCLPSSSHPGGYCTLTDCDLNDSTRSCGEFAVCVPTNDNSYCVRRCTFDPSRPQPQSCRNLPGESPEGDTAYVCIKDPFDRTPSAGLCVPDCTRINNVCRPNTTCDSTTRNCIPMDCRRTSNVCEPMGLSCDMATGQCIRCSDLRNSQECTRPGRPCAIVVGNQCRPRCSSTMPCPAGTTCTLALGVCFPR